MRRPSKLRRMSEEQYLANEKRSTLRHEYVDGYVFAMTGATEAHNIICVNIAAFLHGRLRGQPCRATVNDMKVKVDATRSIYYPDIMVNCAPFQANNLFASEPALIVEVLSKSTAAIDLREKLIAYQKLPTLREYMIVHQDRQQVELYRRDSGDQWVHFVAYAEDELILESLPGDATTLPVATIYDGYVPPGRVKEQESEYSW